MDRNDQTVLLLLLSAILLLIAQIFENSLLFAISFPVLMFSWMWLGALKKGKVRGLAKYSLLGVLAIWLIGFIAMERMDHSSFGKFFGGLPLGTAIMMYVAWFLPFLVGTVAYSIRFEKDYITMEDLEEFSKATDVKMEDLIEIENVKG
ncbi:hypothetical protein [Clostridium sp. Cult1]|uniref:hypothetical protein n=1 Tax=Clostridium sp. Cult1 TaxID=2079002 RepID=UPI001F43F962|nr:hypothetical protein [Clostridium sp. Cult1]MCF6463528.1 hypothetical protein [Clostridium sp. Cult1]